MAAAASKIVLEAAAAWSVMLQPLGMITGDHIACSPGGSSTTALLVPETLPAVPMVFTNGGGAGLGAGVDTLSPQQKCNEIVFIQACSFS